MAPKAADSFPATTPETASARPAASVKSAATPEEQELARKREEQAALEAELTERELRGADLRAELAAFEQQYLHFVGSKYAELDELKARLAERAAQKQPGNEQARRAAEDARSRADETKFVAGDKSTHEPKTFSATPETKRLYREVAKKIHPDLTSNRDDRAKRQLLMAEANRAYERGDQDRLAKILAEYEHSPEAFEGQGPAAELVRVIRRVSQARARLAEIEAEMQELLRSDIHQLKLRVDEAEKDGHDIFRQIMAKVDEQIAAARQRLSHEERGR